MAMNLLVVYQYLFSWLPVWFQVVVLGLIALIIIFLVVKVVGFVLDAIPFL